MTTDEAYERGKADGEIRERLSSHDRHFELINGQLDRVAKSLTEMTVAVSQVASRQQAIIDTTKATQDALQVASDRRWSRWQKIFAAVTVLTAILGVYLAWRATK